MIRKFLYFCFFASICSIALAQIDNPDAAAVSETISTAIIHPIDQKVMDLLEADQSTNGQVQALFKGSELWDEELNRVYKELVKSYGKNEELKTALKNAQNAWIKFRDAEQMHLQAIFATKEGTMYRIFLASDNLEIIKSRAIELQKRLDDFTESN
ncbi:MAG: DUF1311 domain-containing protein [Candidatus Riflebacteria bacterium]|nr:DUF1311 domain-containing protein [Candidatus Riflebacteria bacterium]